MSSKKSDIVFGNQSGFTLMEILIVFIIMSLVTGYGLGTAVLTSRSRARDTQRKTHLANLARALEIYINDYGVYPSSNASGQILGCGTNGVQPCAWGGEWKDDNGTTYISQMPEDPAPTGNYYYNANGLGWQIYARLERDDDPDIDNNGDDQYVPADDDFSFDCGTGNCNYGQTSGNSQPGGALP